jgi:hypothetical protein
MMPTELSLETDLLFMIIQRQYYEALMAQQREHYDRSIEYLKKEADWLRTVVENLTK